MTIEQALDRFVLLTQNVDGLHRLAGTRNLIDIHGDVLAVRCTGCDARGRLTPDALRGLDSAPTCERCGGTLRPDVVLFEEMLPMDKQERLQDEMLIRTPDLVLVAGTTAMFPYIAQPVFLAAQAGLPTVEVNPESTALSAYVRWSLRGPAGTYLPAIADVIVAARDRNARK